MTACPLPAYAASLRVYEPLAAFAGEERRRWERYLDDGSPFDGAAGRAAGAVAERESSLRALVGLTPPVLPGGPERAFVTEVDGVVLVCPWRTRLRALEALQDFAEELPDEVLAAFTPRPVVVEAGEELDRRRLEAPALRSHVLTSPWQVPLRWFVLVEAEERQLSLGTPVDAGGASPGRRTGRELVYRTAMSRARRRVAKALAVLRRTVEEGAVTAGVEDLGRWLEEFHPRSLVELDYGGLVHLLDDDALTADESARDVAVAVAALADGEQLRAAAAYSRVTTRMRALQAVEAAN